MRFYCTKDGAGPADPIDWRARLAPADAIEDLEEMRAARAAVNVDRIKCASHFVRNGNGPRTTDLAPADVAPLLADLAIGDDKDDFGGRSASVKSLGVMGTLRCPECLAPARCVED